LLNAERPGRTAGAQIPRALAVWFGRVFESAIFAISRYRRFAVP